MNRLEDHAIEWIKLLYIGTACLAWRVYTYSVPAIENCVIIVSRECVPVLVETRAHAPQTNSPCALLRSHCEISHFTDTDDDDHDNDNGDSLCEWFCFVRESHARFLFYFFHCSMFERGRRATWFSNSCFSTFIIKAKSYSVNVCSSLAKKKKHVSLALSRYYPSFVPHFPYFGQKLKVKILKI